MVNQTDAEALQRMMGSTGPQYLATDGITAHAGGGKAGAVLLTTYINRVTTVASANNSVMLPAAVLGSEIVVSNAAATNALAIFSNGADTINALTSATAYSLAAGSTVHMWCAKTGQWHALSGA